MQNFITRNFVKFNYSCKTSARDYRKINKYQNWSVIPKKQTINSLNSSPEVNMSISEDKGLYNSKIFDIRIFPNIISKTSLTFQNKLKINCLKIIKYDENIIANIISFCSLSECIALSQT